MVDFMMQKKMNNAVGHMAGKLWVMVMMVLVMICSCGANENDKQDLHENCLQWASAGECEANPSYMLENCARSCILDRNFEDMHTAVDNHEKCGFWAQSGECDANPNYMLRNCRKSCAAMSGTQVEVPDDFYSISERDIYGNLVYFDEFRGKNVYIVNVASQCGHTVENYDLLRELSDLRSDKFEVLIFPCNQFGGQEPGGSDEISYFAQQAGFDGRVMAKGDVNGPHTRPTFLYLKSRTGKKHISWNFEGKFLVSSDGNVEALTIHNALETIKEKLRKETVISVSSDAEL